jgi:hypothetical protein
MISGLARTPRPQDFPAPVWRSLTVVAADSGVYYTRTGNRGLCASGINPRYTVKYKTDGGELIEVWIPGKDVLVLEGMHGILTYSTHPEKILSFRVVEQELTRWRTGCACPGALNRHRSVRLPARHAIGPKVHTGITRL